MLDCELKCIYREKHTTPVKIEKHTHPYDELTYYLSGKGTVCTLDTVHNYKRGMFGFHRAGTPHDEINPEPCDTIWMHFEFCVSGINLSEGLFEDPRGELLPIIQKLKNSFIEKSDYQKQMTEAYLSELIVTLALLQQGGNAPHYEMNWQNILDYIEENSAENIDFYELSANNNYSYDRFRHLFRERFGVSPHAYLIKQRLEHAKRLLENSKSDLTDIAYNCGFHSSSQFSNLFKKHFGQTPGEYRIKYKTPS